MPEERFIRIAFMDWFAFPTGRFKCQPGAGNPPCPRLADFILAFQELDEDRVLREYAAFKCEECLVKALSDCPISPPLTTAAQMEELYTGQRKPPILLRTRKKEREDDRA